MSFWENYKEPAGNFLTSAEKTVMLENGIPFKVISIYERVGNYGPEFTLEILTPNPETGDEESRSFSFSKGADQPTSRDRMLLRMNNGTEDYPGLNNGGDPVWVKFDKAKQFWKLVPAQPTT